MFRVDRRNVLRDLLFVVAMTAAVVAPAGRTASAPRHDRVLFTGRFDFSDPSVPVFSHVSSSIKANFRGTGVEAVLSSAGGTSYLYVIVDGHADPAKRRLIMVHSRRPKSFVLAAGLPPGDHQVEIVKENQYDTKAAFLGFRVAGAGGTLLPRPARPALALEFYGDSNPAGHSAYDVFDKGAVVNNGGYFTYPGIAARLLGAEYHNISMGGIGITGKAWRNLRNFYSLVHMNDPARGANLWDFRGYSPAAVIVNVGSNDVLARVPASAAEIKEGWKTFVLRDLRPHYPQAHIVLLESYGWSRHEPAGVLEETVAELRAAGERNISWARIPWLWGQEHAVINEHAGFADIVARHLARELHLPEPAPSDLSSFAPYGRVSNGGFEKSTLPGIADGWRPRGPVTLVRDRTGAAEGTNYLKLGKGASVHFANDARPGSRFTATGRLRGSRAGLRAKLSIRFNDEDQRTIAVADGLVTLGTSWREFTTTATAPAGTWAVWVVPASDDRGDVFVDDVRLSAEKEKGEARTSPDR